MKDLTRRDDLESLAFCLFYLLRGNLPWGSLHKWVTRIGRMSQVRMLKELWPGTRLGKGYPADFGHFLDDLRTLEFHTSPPYERYLRMFSDAYVRSGFSQNDRSLDWHPIPGGHSFSALAPLVI